MYEILAALQDRIINLTYLEMVAFSTGLIYVWLAMRENVWCWPIGLVNVIAFLIISYQAMFYSDMMLQVFYLVLTIYGWQQWVSNNQRQTANKATTNSAAQTLQISLTPPKTWLYILFFCIVSTLLHAPRKQLTPINHQFTPD